MELIILFISLDIVASKFLTCFISSVRMEPSQFEKNRVSKKIMEFVGIEDSIWFPFFLTILAVIVTVWALFAFNTPAIYHYLYIFTGLYLTAIHLGIAHSSYTGRKNFITERL